ncbi:hypothetical protein C8R44DRAFT_942542 [Mycena epipterygia]|nr:hypothetical protein C8R44DRAFT_942542 [Mycena epipterygia]
MSSDSAAVSQPKDYPTRLLDDDCVAEICSYAVDDVLSDETPSYATYAQLMPHFPRRWRVRRENHRTILAFALACKKHLNPALDVLWKEIDGLARLLNILPSFRKTASMRLAPPTAKHWARFDYYACRVFRVDYTNSDLDPAICAHISQSHPQPIFPNLHRFIVAERRYFSPVMLLMAPWLRQMPLAPEIHDRVSFDIILTYRDIPQVNALSVGYARAITPGFTCFLSSICSLDIIGLQCDLHKNDILALSSLVFLTSFTISIEGDAWFLFLSAHSLLFPALRNLDVAARPRTLIPMFLAHITSPGLTRLSIRPMETSSEPFVIQSICSIASENWPRLQTLFVDITDRTLTPAALTSLARFTSLEHLRFAPAVRVRFSPDEFISTVGSLHQLVSFSAFGWRGLTIASLQHLAEHCPRLRSLDLTFEPPNEPPPAGTPRLTHVLDTLIINASYDGPYLGNIDATVCHLHHMFPALRTIDMPAVDGRIPQGITKRAWETVEQYLYEGCPRCS